MQNEAASVIDGLAGIRGRVVCLCGREYKIYLKEGSSFEHVDPNEDNAYLKSTGHRAWTVVEIKCGCDMIWRKDDVRGWQPCGFVPLR
jgi:hypothetical protein